MRNGWDDNKKKTGETNTGTMSGYGLTVGANGNDSKEREANYTRTAGLSQSWALSPVGDWNGVTTNGTAQTRTHCPTHELLTGGGQNVSTDVKGNITLIPSGLRPSASSLLLNWDFDNRLSTADVGNNSSVDVTYKFDALGRRVYRQSTSSTTVYVQSGQQTIADYVAGTAASSPSYRYVYASYIDEPVFRYKPTGSESIYYHRNQQYSIIALTSGSGTIVERYAYSAYGSPMITDASGITRSSSAYDNRYTYTGREWDAELALYHYRARMYDSSLGRFCSRDPVGYEGSPQNLYLFLESNPIKLADPAGLAALRLTGPCEINIFFGDTFHNNASLDRMVKESIWDKHSMCPDKYLGVVGCGEFFEQITNDLGNPIRPDQSIPKFPDIPKFLAGVDFMEKANQAVEAASALATKLCNNRREFRDDGCGERYRCGEENQRCDSVKFNIGIDKYAERALLNGIGPQGDPIPGLPNSESTLLLKKMKALKSLPRKKCI